MRVAQSQCHRCHTATKHNPTQCGSTTRERESVFMVVVVGDRKQNAGDVTQEMHNLEKRGWRKKKRTLFKATHATLENTTARALGGLWLGGTDGARPMLKLPNQGDENLHRQQPHPQTVSTQPSKHCHEHSPCRQPVWKHERPRCPQNTKTVYEHTGGGLVSLRALGPKKHPQSATPQSVTPWNNPIDPQTRDLCHTTPSPHWRACTHLIH